MDIVVESQKQHIETQNKMIDTLIAQIKELKKEMVDLKMAQGKDQEEIYRLKLVENTVDKLRNTLTKNTLKVNAARGTREYFRACSECGLLHDDRRQELVKCELCNNQACNERYGCLRTWRIEKKGRFDVCYCTSCI